MTQDLALLLAGALMGEDGEIGEREGERDTASLVEAVRKRPIGLISAM